MPHPNQLFRLLRGQKVQAEDKEIKICGRERQDLGTDIQN